MPISYEGKDYDFQELENKIKKEKPGIKSPGGYVHAIEEKEHIAQLRARLQKIASEDNTITDEERDATEYYGQIPENVSKKYRQRLIERRNSE